MSLPHCVSSAALDIEHGREGGHFALQKRPHNLVAPNAVAHIATSQKGLACTPRDPKCGRFFFVFLDFGQISPPAIFGQPWPATGGEGGRGGGGRGGPTPPAAASRGLEHPLMGLTKLPKRHLTTNDFRIANGTHMQQSKSTTTTFVPSFLDICSRTRVPRP